MGLGKTLQTICIVANRHHEMDISIGVKTRPSLIICPPTLMSHWHHEFGKYVKHMKCLTYRGPVAEREALRRDGFVNYDVVITSYDIVRNDIVHLSQLQFFYCVLDEGHVIKNKNAKTTIAVKQIAAHHRLILTGTPIQNNVLELWSLFDFLMPGFLGDDKQFQRLYSRPISKSKDPKSSLSEKQAGAAALDTLHKQVLPFLLRRLKEDVLQDLPPKIIQDYECELSDVQRKLYDAICSVTQSNMSDVSDLKNQPKGHVFQTMQLLRKACNHPKLLLNDQSDVMRNVMQQCRLSPSQLQAAENAPKLSALRSVILHALNLSTLNRG